QLVAAELAHRLAVLPAPSILEATRATPRPPPVRWVDPRGVVALERWNVVRLEQCYRSFQVVECHHIDTPRCTSRSARTDGISLELMMEQLVQELDVVAHDLGISTTTDAASRFLSRARSSSWANRSSLRLAKSAIADAFSATCTSTLIGASFPSTRASCSSARMIACAGNGCSTCLGTWTGLPFGPSSLTICILNLGVLSFSMRSRSRAICSARAYGRFSSAWTRSFSRARAISVRVAEVPTPSSPRAMRQMSWSE